MKVKTANLIGAQLDWAVAKSNGASNTWLESFVMNEFATPYKPSTDWAQGGPIIERERINTAWEGHDGIEWEANTCQNLKYTPHGEYIDGSDFVHSGPTPLISAMRCYVASKLGDEVEVPDELS